MTFVTLAIGCGPQTVEPCVEVEWIESLEVGLLCDVAVRRDGTIVVLAETPAATLIELDGSGRALEARTLHPGEDRSDDCVRVLEGERSELWASTTLDREDRGSDSFVHRIDTDGTHITAGVSPPRESWIVHVAPTRDGAVVGGWQRPDPGGPRLSEAVVVSIDDTLAVRERWIGPAELGGIRHVFAEGDAIFVVAKQASIDYGAAYLLRVDDLAQPPSWMHAIGGFGDASQPEVVAATLSDSGVLLSRAHGEDWFVDHWTLDGEHDWQVQPESLASDDAPPMGAIAADDRLSLALLGATDPLALVLTPEGDCLCEEASALPPTAILREVAPSTFIAAGGDDDGSWIARMRVLATR